MLNANKILSNGWVIKKPQAGRFREQGEFKMKIFFLIIITFIVFNSSAQTALENKKRYAEIVITSLNLTIDTTSLTILSRKRHAKKIAKMLLREKFGYCRMTMEVPLICASYGNYWVIWKKRWLLRKRKGLNTTVVINAINCEVEIIHLRNN